MDGSSTSGTAAAGTNNVNEQNAEYYISNGVHAAVATGAPLPPLTTAAAGARTIVSQERQVTHSSHYRLSLSSAADVQRQQSN